MSTVFHSLSLSCLSIKGLDENLRHLGASGELSHARLGRRQHPVKGNPATGGKGRTQKRVRRGAGGACLRRFAGFGLSRKRNTHVVREQTGGGGWTNRENVCLFDCRINKIFGGFLPLVLVFRPSLLAPLAKPINLYHNDYIFIIPGWIDKFPSIFRVSPMHDGAIAVDEVDVLDGHSAVLEQPHRLLHHH